MAPHRHILTAPRRKVREFKMRRMSLSLGDIEAFLSVAETGSFSRSASHLGLSQPAVTARIRHLEQSLGVPLFHRTTRKVTLTDMGARLRSRVDHTMDELRSVLIDLDDEANLRRGRVAVGASATISPDFLGGVISAFRARQPLVQVTLLDDGHALERLLRRDIDVAIIPSDPADEHVSVTPMLRDPYLLAVPVTHPMARRASVKFSDLIAETFVALPPETEAWRRLADALPEESSGQRSPAQTRNPFAVAAMVRAGLGVGVLPEMLTEVLKLDGIRLLSIDEPGLDREVGTAVLRGRALSPAATAFVEIVKQAAARRNAIREGAASL